MSLLILLAGSGAWAQEMAPAPSPSSPPPTEAAAPNSPASPAASPAVGLEAVVAAAKVTAPGLRVAKANLDAARAAFGQVRAKNGLSLGLTGGYTHGIASQNVVALKTATGVIATGQENVVGSAALSGPSTSVGLTAQQFIPDDSTISQETSIGLTGMQTLFDGYLGGRSAALVKQADYSYRAAQVAYDASLKALILQTQQAYYTLLSDQNTLLVRQAVAKQAAENVALEEGLLQAQRATPLDVLQVQVALNQAQLDVRTAQNTIDTDRRKLSLLVGWPIDKQYAVAYSPAPEMQLQPLEDALKTAYQNRPELRTLTLNVAAAGVNLDLQKSQYSPIVSVNGSLSAQVVSTGPAAGTSGTLATAGVSIALPPILDGGLVTAQVQQAVDQLSALQIQQDQERQSISIDVESALFSVQDTRDRLDLAGQNVRQAQGVYDLERAKLAVGLETTLNVLTAFSALVTAQVGLEQARSNYMLAIVNLNDVMGL
jgi:outer membrane protein